MHGTIELAGDAGQDAARARAYATPLADLDPGNPELFKTDSFWPTCPSLAVTSNVRPPLPRSGATIRSPINFVEPSSYVSCRSE